MSCIPISAFKSESIINSSSSPNFTGRLYALYRSAINVIFTVLSLILDCPSLELAVAVYKGSYLLYIAVIRLTMTYRSSI